jgi:hypothetical protein
VQSATHFVASAAARPARSTGARESVLAISMRFNYDAPLAVHLQAHIEVRKTFGPVAMR